MTPFRASPDYPHWPDVANLIHRSFAYMTPILGHRARAMAVTPDTLATATVTGCAHLIEDTGRPIACLFTRLSRDHEDALYLGWLAVDASIRGKGLSRRLFEAAETEAREATYTALTLDTGATLTDLHRVFLAFGFEKVQDDGKIASFKKAL